MKHLSTRVFVLTLLTALSCPAVADPGGRGHGHGRHGRDDDERGHSHGPKGSMYTEQYLDGLCMVERRWDKHGRYREERRCREPAAYGTPYGIQYAAPPTVIAVPPPAIVIQPPALVIRP